MDICGGVEEGAEMIFGPCNLPVCVEKCQLSEGQIPVLCKALETISSIHQCNRLDSLFKTVFELDFKRN